MSILNMFVFNILYTFLKLTNFFIIMNFRMMSLLKINFYIFWYLRYSIFVNISLNISFLELCLYECYHSCFINDLFRWDRKTLRILETINCDLYQKTKYRRVLSFQRYLLLQTDKHIQMFKEASHHNSFPSNKKL